jgi:RimJ/RimL family protein N-acetyltransferase
MSDAWSTERLLARPPERADRDAYLRLFLDPAVGTWLSRSPERPLGEPEILGMLAADERHWDEYGFGPWTLLDRDDGTMVGRGGLRWTELEAGWSVELPWAVASSHWGRGLATEGALAAVDYARSLELPEVIALIVPGNGRSRRVAEKAGFELDGETRHAGLLHLVYRLGPADSGSAGPA